MSICSVSPPQASKHCYHSLPCLDSSGLNGHHMPVCTITQALTTPKTQEYSSTNLNPNTQAFHNKSKGALNPKQPCQYDSKSLQALCKPFTPEPQNPKPLHPKAPKSETLKFKSPHTLRPKTLNSISQNPKPAKPKSTKDPEPLNRLGFRVYFKSKLKASR